MVREGEGGDSIVQFKMIPFFRKNMQNIADTLLRIQVGKYQDK